VARGDFLKFLFNRERWCDILLQFLELFLNGERWCSIRWCIVLIEFSEIFFNGEIWYDMIWYDMTWDDVHTCMLRELKLMTCSKSSTILIFLWPTKFILYACKLSTSTADSSYDIHFKLCFHHYILRDEINKTRSHLYNFFKK
jgi:hypothetical protein